MKDPKGPTKAYKSPEELAKKHKVSLETIMKQVKMGTKVEGEHTTSKSGARITALQHIDELPDYYTKLKKVEKKGPMKENLNVDVEAQYKKETKYCLLCRKNETRQECSWGPSMWDKYSIAKIHPANEEVVHEDHKEIASGKKKDDEGYMARVEFDQIERSVNILRKLVKKGDQQLPAWVQSKITRAADFIDTAAEYMSSDEDVSEGMDMKSFKAQRSKVKRSEKRAAEKTAPGRRSGIHNPSASPERAARHRANVDPDFEGNDERNYPGGKLRPNKVRKAKALGELGEGKTYEQFILEVAAWQRKEGKNPEGGLNERGRKSYERENPGSDLKPPQPEGGPRKRSFCARMGGMPGPMKDEKGRPTRKALSLRKWKC